MLHGFDSGTYTGSTALQHLSDGADMDTVVRLPQFELELIFIALLLTFVNELWISATNHFYREPLLKSLSFLS
jgi:hypothetical protein